MEPGAVESADESRVVSSGFEEWYPVARRKVASAVAVMTGDLDVAADVADEAMVRAYERWDRVSAMESAVGWAVQVARNAARRRLRRRSLEQRLLRRSADRRTVAPLEARDEVLWAAVRALPTRQRETVVLHHVADLTEREVASIMGISAGTVSTNLREGMRKLREALPSDTDGGDHATDR